ncbi:hypothetical protein GMSM_05190 [Geomonas sp. Red276]
MKKHLLFIALFLVVLTVSPARATLISADDVIFGAGSFTVDTSTGLEWLDLSQTFGQSMDSILAASGVGERYQGLRYATADELRTFYTDAGLYAHPQYTVETFQAEYNLMSLIGYAPGFSNENQYFVNRYLWGITGTLAPRPPGVLENRYIGSALYASADYPLGSGFLRAYVNIGANVDDVTFRSTDTWSAEGSFLVREEGGAPSVPEPSTFLLLTVGLAGVGWLKRKIRG